MRNRNIKKFYIGKIEVESIDNLSKELFYLLKTLIVKYGNGVKL